MGIVCRIGLDSAKVIGFDVQFVMAVLLLASSVSN